MKTYFILIAILYSLPVYAIDVPGELVGDYDLMKANVCGEHYQAYKEGVIDGFGEFLLIGKQEIMFGDNLVCKLTKVDGSSGYYKTVQECSVLWDEPDPQIYEITYSIQGDKLVVMGLPSNESAHYKKCSVSPAKRAR